MSRKSDWQMILNEVAHKQLEQQLSDFCGHPVKLSKRQMDAYGKRFSEIEREREIECAINLLESEGYRVIKPRKSCL